MQSLGKAKNTVPLRNRIIGGRVPAVKIDRKIPLQDLRPKSKEELRQFLSKESLDFSAIPLPASHDLITLQLIFREELEKVAKKVVEQSSHISQDIQSPSSAIREGEVRAYHSEEHGISYVHFDNQIIKNIVDMISATHRGASRNVLETNIPDTTGSKQKIDHNQIIQSFIESMKNMTMLASGEINLSTSKEALFSSIHRREEINKDISTEGDIHCDGPSTVAGVFMLKTGSVELPLDVYNRAELTEEQKVMCASKDEEFSDEQLFNNSKAIREKLKPILTLAPHGKNGVLCGFMRGTVIHGVREKAQNTSYADEKRVSFFNVYRL